MGFQCCRHSPRISACWSSICGWTCMKSPSKKLTNSKSEMSQVHWTSRVGKQKSMTMQEQNQGQQDFFHKYYWSLKQPFLKPTFRLGISSVIENNAQKGCFCLERRRAELLSWCYHQLFFRLRANCPIPRPQLPTCKRDTAGTSLSPPLSSSHHSLSCLFKHFTKQTS